MTINARCAAGRILCETGEGRVLSIFPLLLEVILRILALKISLLLPLRARVFWSGEVGANRVSKVRDKTIYANN